MAAQLPGSTYIKRLHERGLTLPIVVTLLVVVILVQGYISREPPVDPANPAEPQPTAVPTPTATPFRPDLEKIPLTYFSDFWLQLGERSHRHLVTLGEAQLPGVKVSPGYAISSIPAADAATVAPGESPEGELVAVNGKLGLALFRLADEVGSPPLPSAAALHAGAWLGAVTADVDRGLQVVPGHLVSAPPPGAEHLEVAMAFPASLEVAAVVDLDSRLAGVALRGPRGVQVLSVEAARAVVEGLAASPACRAVDVVPVPDDVRASLRLTGGVAVEAVEVAAFPAPPDLRPGDIVLQLGQSRIATPEEFAEAWDSQAPGSRARFLITRGSRRIVRRAEVPGRDCRPDSATPRELPLLGAVVQWAPGDGAAEADGPGFRLLHVPEGSRAAAAGLERGDLLAAIDGKALSWPEDKRLLEPWTSGHAPVLSIRRRGATRLTTLPEPEEDVEDEGE
jgi:S1-C subfamily serine protease